jgi:hypothetical protein
MRRGVGRLPPCPRDAVPRAPGGLLRRAALGLRERKRPRYRPRPDRDHRRERRRRAGRWAGPARPGPRGNPGGFPGSELPDARRPPSHPVGAGRRAAVGTLSQPVRVAQLSQRAAPRGRSGLSRQASRPTCTSSPAPRTPSTACWPPPRSPSGPAACWRTGWNPGCTGAKPFAGRARAGQERGLGLWPRDDGGRPACRTGGACASGPCSPTRKARRPRWLSGWGPVR